MSRDDVLRKDVIHQIMCHGSVDTTDIERRTASVSMSISPPNSSGCSLATDGLVELQGRASISLRRAAC